MDDYYSFLFRIWRFITIILYNIKFELLHPKSAMYVIVHT